jgi:peptide/nickel transport system substrate-binding protein
MRNSIKIAMTFLVCLASASAATARDLVFARTTEHAAIDPLFNAAGPEASTTPNMFESLVEHDKNFQRIPLLATAWRIVAPTVWEFDLREGVTFHDGSPFTAEDVVFSFHRAETNTASPANFARNLKEVQSVEILGPHKIRIHTYSPAPLLLDKIGTLPIISHIAGEGMETEDYNSGKAAIGTGQYKFVRWVRGDRLEMAANENYWGEKPEFGHVTYRFISNNAARIAALLSGDVDIIENVPPTDLETIKSRGGFTISQGLTTRLTHIQVDAVRDQSTWVTDNKGKPLDVNPLKDARVREAISLMIDRDLLVNRIANGLGMPAGQVVPPGLGGYDPDLTPDPYDPARAKQLLTEAGYPNGFGLTIHSTNDRFPEDSASLQALAQFFTRGGLTINSVDSVPFSVILQMQKDRKLSLFQYAYNGCCANASTFLTNMMMTNDPKTGTGASNRTLYSDPKFDALMNEALQEMDEDRRNALFAKATRHSLKEERGNLIPLYWQAHAWASKQDLTFDANLMDQSLVRFVHIVD